MDSALTVICYVDDGDRLKKGIALRSFGFCPSLLKSERVIFNLIQRMSGIATETNGVVQRIKGTGTKIVDTRKTMPGLSYA